MSSQNGHGMGQRDWGRMAATGGGRRPFPGRALPGGPTVVWVSDEKGLAVPLAEVYLVRAERGTQDLIEQVAAARTDYLGKARFDLPAAGPDDVLLFLAEKAGYGRGTVTARPGMMTRIQIAREAGEFRPEQIVLREHRVEMGMGMPGPITDAEFLTELAVRAAIQPEEAGALAAKWRDGRMDDFVRFVALKLGLVASDQATLMTLAKERNREGILGLVSETTRPFYVKSAFLIPAGFFAASMIFLASRSKR